MNRRTKALLTTILIAACTVSAATPCDEAAATYDLELASRALVGLRADGAADGMVRCTLTVAELIRLRFEAEHDTAHRMTLGQRIDTAADEGLALVDHLPETAERERLRADLIATKIRSPFRAKKYEAAFRAALERARELDPDNARALVTAAKPLIFADSVHGGDPAAALPLLDRALELEPQLESALLLRGLARSSTGDDDGARADWRLALELNPACRPAQQRLQE